MTLSAGAHLGPYEIIGPLGAGGMGEVYRARDPRLGREVAIKVLHADGSEGSAAHLLQRFEQEARAGGMLNHPNILEVHDVGSENGRPYVVSELLYGITLRERLAGGPLPARKAVEYAIQMAQGLAAAHEKRIVHRDLKPENVFITNDGQVKLLDFGLAKVAQRPQDSDVDTAQLASIADTTPSGTVLGTMGYMAPEQVRGQAVDARTDIFAFGAVFYEMLSGHRAFREPTPADTMTAILTKDPVPLTRNGSFVPALDRIVRRCLEKDVDARFQCARDLAFALDEVSTLSSPGNPAGSVEPGLRRRWSGRVIALAVLSLAAGAFGEWALVPRPVAPNVILTRITADPGLTAHPALSRDGRLLAYASDRAGEGSLDIWVRQLAGGQPLRLTKDAADEHEPAFSPDGTLIAFRSERGGGGIYVIPALGGEARLIVAHGHWPRYSPDGSQIACIIGATRSATSGAGTLAIVPATGGTPRLFEALKNVSMPIWSPDGKHLLLTGDAIAATIFDWWIVSAEPGASQKPIKTEAVANFQRYGLTTTVSSSGNPDPFPKPFDWVGNRILFSGTRRDSTNLWDVEISPTFRIEKAPRQLTQGTQTEAHPVLGPDGRIVFSVLSSNVDLWELPIDANQGRVLGPARPLTQDPAQEALPSISDDGRTVAFKVDVLGISDLWRKDVVTDRTLALTATPEEESYPVVTRDGANVLYASFAEPKPSIYSIPVNGGIPEKICARCGAPTDLSPDARYIVLQLLPAWFEGRAPSPRTTLAVYDRVTKQRSEILSHPEYNLYRGHVSPDGKWILFHADKFGADTREFVAPFRGPAPVPESSWIAVTNGETWDDAPRWSPDGNLIYYLSMRDGFRCIWAQRLDPVTRRPVGDPLDVQHLHRRQRWMGGISLASLDLGVSRRSLVFNMMEISGNIWSAEIYGEPATAVAR
jgi:Tol biopolymer transport system component